MGTREQAGEEMRRTPGHASCNQHPLCPAPVVSSSRLQSYTGARQGGRCSQQRAADRALPTPSLSWVMSP